MIEDQQLSAPASDWVEKGTCGPLIGQFSVRTMYNNAEAFAEIYWINDPRFVGLRYPDNARLAVGAGWLHWRSKEIQKRFEQFRDEYIRRANGHAKPGLKLKLKGGEQQEKPKLLLKKPMAAPAPSAATKPKLALKSKPQLKPKLALKPRPQLKPKLALKPKSSRKT